MSGVATIDLEVERRNRGKSKAGMAKWIGIANATWRAAEEGDPISEASQKAIADKLDRTVTETFRDAAEAAPA